MALQPDLSKLSEEERAEHHRLVALVEAYFTVMQDMNTLGFLTLEHEGLLSGRLDACQRRVDELYEKIAFVPPPRPRLVTG